MDNGENTYNKDGLMEQLSIDDVDQINYMMAKEFIDARLDIEPTHEKITQLANCISTLEALKKQ